MPESNVKNLRKRAKGRLRVLSVSHGAVANRFIHEDLSFDILCKAETLEFDINLFHIDL